MILYPTPFISKQASLVTSGLVMQLDANNTASYPGSGTTIYDLTGSYNNTLSGGASFTTLNGIKCFDCTTNTQSIQASGTGPSLPTTGYTYVSWARIIPSSAGWRSLFRTDNNLPILVQVGTDNLGFYDSVFRDSGYDVTPIEDVWVQYAVVGDNTSSIFYINGAQVGTVAYGAGGDTHVMWGNNLLAGQPFGYLANLYFYNRKLSFSEIIQQYSYLAPRFVEPVSSNLVLYYDPSNTSSYSGTGATMSNLASGGGLSATLTAASYTSPYLSFNGTTSTTATADSATLEPGSGDWTIEAWINHSVIAGSSRCVIGKTNGGLAADWGYGIRTSSTGSTYMEVGNGTTSINSPAYIVSTNTWYQIVGVWTNVASNSIALYVNGVSQGSSSHSFSSIKNTTASLYLGSFNGGQFSQWFNGKIGVVRMYNKALTGEEILVNYVADKYKYQ